MGKFLMLIFACGYIRQKKAQLNEQWLRYGSNMLYYRSSMVSERGQG
jgi:hypothetical protein